MSHATIPPSRLPELLAQHCKIIDVRSPVEFRSAHVKGVESHPLHQLDAAAFCRAHGTEKPVYILCQSGRRAHKAAKKLTKAGHKNAVVVEGGTSAAARQGAEMVYGEETIP